MSITKSELIERVVDKQSHLSAKDVELAIKTILEEMSKTLSSGGRIEIRGFGSFSLHYREPRVGRNPKTGDSVELEAKHVPHFKPGKELRDRVNQAMEIEQSYLNGGMLDAGEGQPEALKKAIREALGSGNPAKDVDASSTAAVDRSSSSGSSGSGGVLGGSMIASQSSLNMSGGHNRGAFSG